MKRLDLIGLRVGKLTVLKFAGIRDIKGAGAASYWLCQCECGNKKIIKGSFLKSGHTVSCGCAFHPRSDLTGKQIGHWKVLYLDGVRPYGGHGRMAAFWMCECVCGVKRLQRSGNLNSGRSLSCGCSRPNKIHGESGNKTRTVEYTAWCSMIGRCDSRDPIYWENYGARGITVCKRWRHSYPNFLADMGRRPSLLHSLDRIDNDKGYSKANCRWATDDVQMNNRRPRLRIDEWSKEQLLGEIARREQGART